MKCFRSREADWLRPVQGINSRGFNHSHVLWHHWVHVRIHVIIPLDITSFHGRCFNHPKFAYFWFRSLMQLATGKASFCPLSNGRFVTISSVSCFCICTHKHKFHPLVALPSILSSIMFGNSELCFDRRSHLGCEKCCSDDSHYFALGDPVWLRLTHRHHHHHLIHPQSTYKDKNLTIQMNKWRTGTARLWNSDSRP